MERALALARRAADMGEVPVGAVLVRNGSVLAEAHNLIESMPDATAHVIDYGCVEVPRQDMAREQAVLNGLRQLRDQVAMAGWMP